MTSDADCIFCRIIAGEIPCFRLLEEKRVLAFMDINPANPGHALVVPKYHAPDLFSLPADDLTAAALAAQRVAGAVRTVLDPPGLNLLQANGPAAGQSVPHFHIHVLPRRLDDGLPMNWSLVPGDMAEIGDLAERLKAAL